MKNKKSAIVIVSCVLLVAAAGIWIKKSPKKAGGFGKGGFGGMPQTVVSVKTRVAEPVVLHDFIKTNGEIESKSSIAVFPDIGGKVYTTNVSLGSIVKKGDVVAEIDPSEPGTYYTHSKVFAPVSGTVITSVLEPGTKVSTQSVITTIGDVSNLQLKIKVVERLVADVKNGLKAKVYLEAYPDEVFDATVTKVSPVLDQTSRTKEVVLDFDRKDERVNAGMFAKVVLYTVDYKGKVTVPTTCIVTKGKHSYVFVISADGETAVKKEITTGHSVESEIQIDGIEPGEKIVIEGMSVLTDGSKVRDITKED